jgi:hypothetical protein
VKQEPSVGSTFIRGLLAAAFWVGTAKLISRPPAAAWLTTFRSTRRLDTTDVPAEIFWALLAGLAGLVCFLMFASSVRILLQDYWRQQVASMFIRGLLAAAFWVGTAKLISRPPAAAWLTSFRSTRRLDWNDLPAEIFWAPIAGFAGLVCFLMFANSLRVVLKEYGRRYAAAREAAARREAARRYELEMKRREALQAACSHPNMTTARDEVHHSFGGQDEEIFSDVTKCASCGKEISRKTISKYVDGRLTYNSNWYS